MIAADIKLDLTTGYDVTASKEQDGKVRITISISDVDLELWIKDDQKLGDDIIQSVAEV